MKFFCCVIWLVCLITLSHTIYAQSFSSSDKQVSVLELYTSEGCSSCPPADNWFSQLKQDKRLWTEFIPIAFHVDYWDYIGWQDSFADNTYSQRQRQYARNNKVRTVYTPGMLLNGNEWRGWFERQELKLDINVAAGKLSIKVKQQQMSAKYSAKNISDKVLILNIAILGFNLNSKISSGENKGRILAHDFVVLGFRSIKMQQNKDSYIIESTALPEVVANSKIKAIASWVNTEKNLSPIQATGGWLHNK
ncbi:MAG: DUF1223 domain-containing protein [Pseudomonadota bacterium]